MKLAYKHRTNTIFGISAPVGLTVKQLICTAILFFPTVFFGQSQFKLVQVDTASLPKSIHFAGKIVKAMQWTDKLGDNIVITTETDEVKSGPTADEDSRDASLDAYHFITSEDTVKQLWHVHDFIKECPFDIEAKFNKSTPQITDLDKDNIAEIWLLYKTACRSDVSCANMKIIMYEGQQKCAMREINKVQISETEFNGGEYTFDKAFNEGSNEFRDFAVKIWNENILEKWDGY